MFYLIIAGIQLVGAGVLLFMGEPHKAQVVINTALLMGVIYKLENL
jgi:hypothetical protein